ncbi:hypothetical protein BS78_08G098900 [Paspalum vaginatum]|nr:hypothetical protein BS78_08G098900 [Paspalum vaginatum]
MVSSQASAVLRARRWLLPLAIASCCVMRVVIVLMPPPRDLDASHRKSFHVSVGEIVGAMPVPGRQDVVHASPPPPPPERVARTEAPPSSPPPEPPESEEIVDTSPKRRAKRERIFDASQPPPVRQERTRKPAADPCTGRYIYIQDLPSQFNADLLRDCRSMSEWTDMCSHFTLEVIFHNRMRQYGCLTADASHAAAVYVPYYPGLNVGRHLWGFSNGVRDALVEDLVDRLWATPAWAAHGGQDHFLVGGRIAWHFHREDGGVWGSRLLFLPEARNMTALVLESGPWHAGDVGRRQWLIAFAGARWAGGGGTLCDAVIDQCARSRRCGLLQCGWCGRRNDCYAPGNVVRHFKSAAFCLQPPGYSYTRRSAFDAMLAGCVPVFFHPSSAYTQYRWHLPVDHAKYSVFVPGNSVRNGTVRVKDVLRRFGRAEVAATSEQVV